MGQVLAQVDIVEQALGEGILRASRAEQWDVVQVLAAELRARRLACVGPDVRSIEAELAKRSRRDKGLLDDTTFRLYIDAVSSAEIIRKLKTAGWRLVRTKGSHQHYSHPASPGRVVTVPHPKKDIGLGLAKAIEKASGVRLLP